MRLNAFTIIPLSTVGWSPSSFSVHHSLRIQKATHAAPCVKGPGSPTLIIQSAFTKIISDTRIQQRLWNKWFLPTKTSKEAPNTSIYASYIDCILDVLAMNLKGDHDSTVVSNQWSDIAVLP